VLLCIGSIWGQTGEASGFGFGFRRRSLSAVAESTQVQDPYQKQKAATNPVFKTTGTF